jgi:hypothetical protein
MISRRWGILHGSFWLFQYALDGTLSLGVHVDPVRRVSDTGPYGPYLDLHFAFCVLSVGYHPARANGIVTLQGQGGIMRPEAT